MKAALTCIVLLIFGPAWAFAGSLPSSHLTVVLDFRGPHTTRSVSEMQVEAQRIVKAAGIHLDWTTAAQASERTFPDLVFVKFKGACVVRPDPTYYGELGPPLGPLAFTYETDGAVQPFSQVYCDKVAASVRSAMWGGDFGRADVLMGRALGRVLVHELVHILTRSGEHAHTGVEQKALSGQQLISASLSLSPIDLEELKQSLNQQK